MIVARLVVGLGALMLLVVGVLEIAGGELLAGASWAAASVALGLVSIGDPLRPDRLGTSDAAMALVLVSALLRLGVDGCIWCEWT